jgi:hypothetical protein
MHGKMLMDQPRPPARMFNLLLRLPYLALSTAVSFIRLLPMSNREKDLEILALRHQLACGVPKRVHGL